MALRRKPPDDPKPANAKPAAKEADEDRPRIVNGIRVSDGVAVIRRGG